MGSDVLQGMVLDAIANDYESIQDVVHQVRGFCLQEGLMTPTIDQIVEVAKTLIDAGLARAYRLKIDSDPLVVETIDWSEIGELYFYRSSRGLAILRELGG